MWISQNQKKCMADRHQSTKVSQRLSKKPPEPRATLEEGASGGAEKERKRGRRGKRHKRAERNGEKEGEKEREKKDEEKEREKRTDPMIGNSPASPREAEAQRGIDPENQTQPLHCVKQVKG